MFASYTPKGFLYRAVLSIKICNLYQGYCCDFIAFKWRYKAFTPPRTRLCNLSFTIHIYYIKIFTNYKMFQKCSLTAIFRLDRKFLS